MISVWALPDTDAGFLRAKAFGHCNLCCKIVLDARSLCGQEWKHLQVQFKSWKVFQSGQSTEHLAASGKE